jgi:hypothetical protein
LLWLLLLLPCIIVIVIPSGLPAAAHDAKQGHCAIVSFFSLLLVY